jgi:rare lipoprotein A
VYCFIVAWPLIGPATADSWTGKASFYDYKGPTASGQKPGALTAAHRTLSFGTRLRVTNLRNNRSMVVIVSDRGPLMRGRVVDVSRAAAIALGFHDQGVAQVRVETIATDVSPVRVAQKPNFEADLTK